MKDFKSNEPGGLRNRKEFIGGRPRSDANYGAKKPFNKKPGFGGGKPSFGDRGGNRGGDRDRRELQMHKATCANCGKPCEVPFKPDGSKPVLCSECFGKTRSDDRRGPERRERPGNDRPKRDFDRPARAENPDYSLLVKQVSIIETKLNEILELLQVAKVVTDEVAEEVEVKAKKATKAAAPKKAVKKAVKKVAKKTKK